MQNKDATYTQAFPYGREGGPPRGGWDEYKPILFLKFGATRASLPTSIGGVAPYEIVGMCTLKLTRLIKQYSKRMQYLSLPECDMVAYEKE